MNATAQERSTRKRYAAENAKHAQHAELLVMQINGADDLESNITDMLADIRHLCDAHDFDFAELDSRAYRHYTAEVVSARTGQME